LTKEFVSLLTGNDPNIVKFTQIKARQKWPNLSHTKNEEMQ